MCITNVIQGIKQRTTFVIQNGRVLYITLGLDVLHCITEESSTALTR